MFFLCILGSCTKKQENIVLELSGYNGHSRIDINHHSLFIPTATKDEDFNNKIIEVNLDNKTETVFYESKAPYLAINDLMVNDHYMTWVESEISGLMARVILLDRETNETKILYEAEPDDLELVAPFLKDNIVAWIQRDHDNDDARVVIYDIDKDNYETIGKVYEHSFYNNWVYIDGDSIYWSDIINDENYFVSYNMKTGETQSYQSKQGTPGYIEVGGDYYYALEFRDHRDWTTNQLTFTNVKNDEHIVISDTWISEFRSFGEDVFYIDSEHENIFKYNIHSKEQIKIETALSQVDAITASSDKQYLIIGYADSENRKIHLEIIRIQ